MKKFYILFSNLCFLWFFSSLSSAWAQKVSAGGYFSLAKCAPCDNVFSWGANWEGELGDSTNIDRNKPGVVHDLSGITSIAAGGYHSLALRNDSTVWAWGANWDGYIGDGTYIDRPEPVQTIGMDSVIAIAAGEYHSMALKSDGTVWAWGWNGDGELGDSTTIRRPLPVKVKGITGVIAIAAGSYFSLALKSDGTVWAWGWNGNGQLGDSTTTERWYPVQVKDLSGVTKISAGGYFAMALKNDGTVWSWGANWDGELGDGTFIQKIYRVQVSVLSNTVIDIDAGYYHALAIKNDSTVWGWGYNWDGELGDNTYTSQNSPVQTLGGMSNVLSISAGGYHSLAMRSDGSVWGWGYNWEGEVGNGFSSNDYGLPQRTLYLCPAQSVDIDINLAAACTDYDTLSAGGNDPQPFMVHNYGCDTLFISNVTSSTGNFTINSFPSFIPPIDSAQMIIAFTPPAVPATYSATITVFNNDADTAFCIRGVAVDPPVIAVNPTSFNDTIYFCNDSITKYLTINNTGIGTLNYTIPLNSTPVPTCIVTTTGTCCNYGILNVQFNNINNPSTNSSAGYQDFTSISTTVYLNKTYQLAVQTGYSFEYVNAWIDWNNNGIFESGEKVMDNVSGSQNHTASIVVPSNAVQNNALRMRIVSDDNWNSPACSNVNYGQHEDYTVFVSNWLTAFPLNGTVTPSGSNTVAVTFNSSMVPAGTYTSTLSVVSNDPVNPQVNIPCTLTITGSPAILFSNPCLNYGSQIVGSTVEDSVLLTNTGCDTLKVNNIVVAPSVFTAFPTSVNILPYQSAYIKVTFIPVAAASYTGTVTFQSNIPDTTICLSGTGISPLSLTVPLAAGYGHSLAICSECDEGFSWGYNWYGQLGDGTTTQRLTTVLPGIKGITAVASGYYHSLSLKNDGSLWAWGYNGYGQLGDGTYTQRNAPVQVNITGTILGVSAGRYHSLALKGNGTVWTWGYNGYGQLGDGTQTDRITPVQVIGLTGITAVAGSQNGYFSLALKSDGTVWAWGNNGNGQLGDGTTTQRLTPVQVNGLTGIIAIAAGASHAFALKSDGTVWAWGYNGYGQLGDATTTQRLTPVQVIGLTGITGIDGGRYHSVALKSDSSVWAWGRNSEGQLGDGSTTGRTSPVQVIGVTNAIAINAGYYHTLAIKSDSAVWAWGWNSNGQLGDGTTINRNVPVQTKNVCPQNLFDKTCLDYGSLIVGATLEDSVMVTNTSCDTLNINNIASSSAFYTVTPTSVDILYGQSAYIKVTFAPAAVTSYTGTITFYSNIPDTTICLTGNGILPLSLSAPLAAGYAHSLAICSQCGDDGFSWGYNNFGQLGDGTTTERLTAVLPNIKGTAAVASGYYHSLSLKNNGTVSSWGYNGYGQLGDGTYSQRNSPVQVNITGTILGVASGAYHSLALKGNGTVWAWGNNGNGQLGDGSTTGRPDPIQVSGLTGVTATASNEDANFSLALKSDGTVWAWGYNGNGQLGDGTTTQRLTPVQVSGLTGIIAIAAGRLHSLALRSDSTVWAWGYNWYGQLGDGTTTQRTTPVQVSGLTGVTGIDGGRYHSAALKGDSTLRAWGYNGYGQLGDGTTTNRTTPVQVSGITTAIAITAGYYHTLAMKSDSAVWAWGWNGNGQLGDGTTTNRSIPVKTKNVCPQKQFDIEIPLTDICTEYDTLILGNNEQKIFKVYNLGCDTLLITGVTSSSGEFTVDTFPAKIAPFESGFINISLSPASTGTVTTTIDVYNNDADTAFCLQGFVIPPPIISFVPDSFDITLACSDILTDTFTIYNTGLSNLIYKIDTVDYSASFNGGSVIYCNPPTTGLPTGGGQLTVEAWIYPVGYNDPTYNGIVSWGNRGPLGDGFLLSIQNSGRPSMATWNNDFTPGTGPSATLNQWNHIACVLNGKSVTLYMNGVPVSGTLPVMPSFPSMLLSIGSTDWFGRFFNGKIDEVRIWNKARTQSEILSTMNTELAGNESYLVSYWNFDNQNTNDLAGTNNGTLWGGTGFTNDHPYSFYTLQGNLNDTIAFGDSSKIAVQFSSVGLITGNYVDSILITSNDPVNGFVKIPTYLQVIGASDFQFAGLGDTISPSCLYLDSIMAYTTSIDSIGITNTGCDTLWIDSLVFSPPEFSPDMFTPFILPGDTGGIIVRFSPDTAGTYSGSVSVYTNDLDTTICLKGYAYPPPVISFNPASFDTTLTCCDSIIDSLKIYNTGGSNLIYQVVADVDFIEDFESGLSKWVTGGTPNTWSAVTDPYSGSFSLKQSSTANYVNNMNQYIQLAKKLNVSDAASSVLSFWEKGETECGWDYYYVRLSVNGGSFTTLYTIPCSSHPWTFRTFSLTPFVNDGDSIQLRFEFTSDGSVVRTGINIDDITISGLRAIPDWLSVYPVTDTVAPGDSSVINLAFNSCGKLIGTYLFDMYINSNDPLSNPDTISVTLNVVGAPDFQIASLGDTIAPLCLYLDSIMALNSSIDSMAITNTGCDTLWLDSLVFSPSVFSLDTFTPFILPGDTGGVIVRFSPDTAGTYSGSVTVYTNDIDTAICLKGYAYPPPVISFNPVSFDTTLVCCDSLSDTLRVYNVGGSDLIYNITGLGLGLVGDTSILVIQETPEWGVDMQNFILTNYGKTATKITSAQIASTDFSLYDIIITVGEENAAYYNNISSNKAKFEAFVSSGGVVQYQLANYVGANVNIVGNLNVPNGNNENNNTVQIPSHPIVNGLPATLVGNDASAGYFTNLSGSEQIIVKTQSSGVPTLIEYSYGKGRVIATSMTLGFLYTNCGSYPSSCPVLAKMTEYSMSLIEPIPSWVNLSVTDDTVAPTDSSTISITLNSCGLVVGTYTTAILINSNDPLNNTDTVSLTLNVVGAPDFQFAGFGDTIAPLCLNLDYIMEFSTSTDTIYFSNMGCDTLFLDSLIPSPNEFSVISYPSSVLMGNSGYIVVQFAPLSANTFPGTLNVYTNDIDTVFCLYGQSYARPIQCHNPDSLNIYFPICRDTIIDTVSICNTTGGSDLYWNLSATNGKSVSLNGSNQYVNTGNWTAGSKWTIEAWVRPSSLPGGRHTIAGGMSSCVDWGIVMENGIFGVGIRPGACSQTISSGVSAVVGTWYHIVGTNDGTTARIYVNGVLKNSGNVDPNYLGYAGNTWIGGEACCGNYFPGLVDEVRIWNISRTQAQISSTMNNILTGSEPNLIGYWNFDDGTANDLSSSGHNGTFINGAFTTAPSFIPGWVTFNPVSDTTASAGTKTSTLVFAKAGLAPGVYNYSIYLNSNDPFNAWDTIPVTLTVDSVPTAPPSAKDTFVCFGSPTPPLIATGGVGDTIKWYDDAPLTNLVYTGGTFVSTQTVVGTYTYYITATDSINGCGSLPDTAILTINAAPSAPTAGGNSPACTGQNLSLTASTVSGAAYSWNGPNGFTSTAQNPVITPVTTSEAGTYSVTATVPGCPASPEGTTTVAVNETPVAPSASGTSPICAGNDLSLTASTVGSSTYNWNGPNSFTSTDQNPVILSAATASSGSYSVTATENGCTGTAGTVSVIVNPIPSSPVAGYNNPACTGQTLSLTASTISGAIYSWAGPGSFTSTDQNPTIAGATTAESGTYSVTATVNGCTGSVGTVSVTVNETPAAPTATSNSPVCSGTTLSLSANTSGSPAYSWTGPNSFTSGLQNPAIGNITTLGNGTYSVTASENGCLGPEGTVSVTVNETPAAPTAGNNTPVCVGNDISLTASASGSPTYSWNGPGGFTSALQNPVILSAGLADAGTYSVTATVNGCTGPAGTTSVIVNPSPGAPAAGSNSPVCSGNTVSLTASVISGAAYSWTGPGNFTSASQNPTIPVVSTSASGTYSVTATVPGCPTGPTGTTSVTINQTPSAPAASSNTPVCVGNDLSLTASAPGSPTYAWNGPGGFTSALQNPVILTVTTAEAGTYSVTTTENGCTGPAGIVTVTVNVTPSPPTATSNSPVCSGQTLSLTLSFTASNPVPTFSWNGPNGFTSTLQNIDIGSVTTLAAGTYSVTASVPGCPASAAGTTTCIVNQTPSVPTMGSNAPICAGTDLSLTATTGVSPAYSWNGPGSFTSTLQNPVIVAAATSASGTYSVTATENGCVSPAGTIGVTVNPPPGAPTAGSNSAVCSGNNLSLTASVISGAAYSWTGPNSYTSTYQNPVITGVSTNASGTYSVTATVGGCPTSTEGTTLVTINASPVINLGSDTIQCGGSVLLDAGNPGSGYAWSTIETTQTITVSSTGTYSVTVTDVSSCTASDAINVTINTAVPVVNLGSDVTQCGGTVLLDAGNPGSGYIWSTTETTQTITVSSTGTYSVDVTNSCGTVSDAINITINSGPVVNLGSDIIQCNGTVLLDAGNPGSGYSWSTSETTQTITVSSSGTYFVIITDANSCTASDTINVIINKTPVVINLGSDVTQCGGTVLLDAGNPGSIYTWSTAETTQTITVSSTGTYSVSLTNSCGSASDTIDITIYPVPVVNLGGDIIQGGVTVLLDAGNPGLSYAWSTAETTQTINVSSTGTYFVTVTDVNGCTASDTIDVTIINIGADITQCGSTVLLNAGPGLSYAWSTTETTQTITVSSTGTYYVDVTNSNGTASDTINITINSVPVVNLGADVTQCGGTVLLDAGNPGLGYTWSTTETTQTITVSSTGTYSIIVTDANSCTASDTIDVIIDNSVPVVNLGSDVTRCGGTVLLDAGSGLSYAWSTTETTQTITVSSTGTYSVVLTNSCGSASDTINVTINPVPVVNLGSDITRCGGTVLLNAGNTGLSYTWSTAETTQTVTVSSSGTYSVVVTNAGGCTMSDTVIITINSIPAAPVATPQSDSICFGSPNPSFSVIGTNIEWWNDAATAILEFSGSPFTPTVTATGTYTYYVTQSALGCMSPSDTVTLAINTIPSVPYALDTTVCSASLIPNLTASGVNVQWYSDAALTNLVGTGNSYNTLQTVPGTYLYYVTQSDILSGCESAADTSTLTILLSPAAPTANNAAVCVGNPIPPLTSTGTNVQWYSDAALINLVNTGNIFNTGQTAAGVYTYWVTDSLTGCVSSPDSATLTIDTLPAKPTANDVTVCYGNPAVLTSTGTNPQWYNDGTLINMAGSGSPFNTGMTAVGAYIYYVTDFAAGCGNSPADTVALTINPSPLVTANTYSVTIVQGNSTTLTAYNAMTYTWSPATGLNTTTGQTVVASPTVTTTYTVTGTNQYGCSNSASILVWVNPLGVTSFADPVQNVTIYPNPAINSFTLEFSTTLETPIDIYMFNTLGEKVRVIQSEASQGGGLVKHTYLIDTRAFTEGIYNIEIVTGNGSVNRRVVLFR